MKRLLAPILALALAVTLTACPRQAIATDQPDPHPPTFTWTSQADVHTLTFQPGDQPARQATLLITGEKLQVNPAELKANGGRCEVTQQDVACLLGDLPAKSSPSVIVKGPARLASVVYGRGDNRYFVVARPPAP